ncbi:MAG TPA: ATP-binding protein [Candidatus Acidoferrales bacterium]|nr:ATP-binding protein [Candidatus Acidoferrales bacterium]
MSLSLKNKFTLATALLVLIVVALVSGLYVARLTRQVITQANDRAQFVLQQVFVSAQNALREAAETGAAPVSSSPDDIHDYVQRTLEQNRGLSGLIESDMSFSPTIYEITVSDADGSALISSDPALSGEPISQRPNLSQLVHASFLDQLRILHGPPRVYEVTLPFNIGNQPFGNIHVALASALLRDEIWPGLRSAAWLALGAVLLSTLLTAFVSQVALAPLSRISAQLDRISAGEFDLEPVTQAGELGQVSSKISRIGQQLRDVREIFSTLRENMNQIMAGLEDGLLLFNAEGRAVLVSPSAEKFIDVDSEHLLGRKIEEIFPPGHPLAQALHIGRRGEVDAEGVEPVEVEIAGERGTRRVGASIQAIQENETQMGLLVSLRDLDSLERLGSQLQVSERLAALGRVTAGVAHEVKNPLNSMRVWLEVLKANLPIDPETQQAAKMLDTEIDRLDRVVKTFLEFSRPVELEREEINLPELIENVLASAKPGITQAGVTLVKEIPASFPPIEVDKRLIEQSLLNLVLNACDCMTAGGHLTVTLARLGDMAEIRVGDTGPGIAPENRAKIFQLFFTTRKGGTGLGLANTFRFVQLHNGSIEFDTETGRGTTFRIELPLTRATTLPVSTFRDYSQPFARQR